MFRKQAPTFLSIHTVNVGVRLPFLFAVASLLLSWSVLARPVYAATLTVDTLTDDANNGDCTVGDCRENAHATRHPGRNVTISVTFL